MVQQEQFLNRILCFVTFLFLACNSKDKHVDISVPNILVNVSNQALRQHEGVLYYNKQPFCGYTYQLFFNGDTSRITPYHNGKEEGIMRAWYTNGMLLEERFFKNGKKEGRHKGWWENGNKKFEYQFVNDEHDGELKEWFYNGRLARIFNYSKGYENGSEKMWWPNGDVRANYFVKDGERFGLIGQKLCSTVIKVSTR